MRPFPNGNIGRGSPDALFQVVLSVMGIIVVTSNRRMQKLFDLRCSPHKFSGNHHIEAL